MLDISKYDIVCIKHKKDVKIKLLQNGYYFICSVDKCKCKMMISNNEFKNNIDNCNELSNLKIFIGENTIKFDIIKSISGSNRGRR